jgi:hypothetical protein
MRDCPGCGRSYDRGRFCTADGCALVGPEPASSSAGAGDASLDPMIGEVIDGFRVDAVLGRGASGTVYRATQLALARPVALKVLHATLAADREMVARFHREARAVARLSDPRVVAVLAIGTCAEGRPYIAMELVDGVTLERVLDDGPIAPSLAAALGAQIAGALAETHGAGVIHRDLKPANVMLVGGRVVLVDFGIARTLDDEPRLTAGGIAIGTPHYMAPEQVLGEALDARADLYALGVVLYRMVTGTVPFDGAGVQVMMAHLHAAPPAPRAMAPAVPPALEALILRCLAKRPGDRVASAAELAGELSAVAAAIGDGDAPAPRARPVRMTTDLFGTAVWDSGATRGHRGGWLLALLTVAVLALVAGWSHLSVSDRVAAALGLERDVELDVGGPDQAQPLPHRIMVAASGISLRASLPAVIAPGVEVEIELELWDDDGALRAPEAVVTVQRPDGGVRGLGAPARDAGHYRFRARFPRSCSTATPR